MLCTRRTDGKDTQGTLTEEIKGISGSQPRGGQSFVLSLKAAAKLFERASVCLTQMSRNGTEASADRKPLGVGSLKMSEGVVVVRTRP